MMTVDRTSDTDGPLATGRPDPLPPRGRMATVQAVYAVVLWPVVRGLFRLAAFGTENVPRTGGAVVAANHFSHLDSWALAHRLWPGRRFRWMAKAELFDPIRGPILRAGGAFPIARGRNDLTAIRTAMDVVGNGDVLLMFPEGTRREKGMRKKLEPRPHTGAARIALAAGVPLIPAAIVGTDHLLRLERWRVIYGPALPLDDLRRRYDRREAAEIATDQLWTEIRELEQGLRA